MSRSISDERAYGIGAAQAVLAKVNPKNPLAQVLADKPLTFSPTGSLDVKRWFDAHSGSMVDTVQARVAEDGRVYAPFEPGPRLARDVRSTGVSMGSRDDFSFIDFRDMLKIAHNEDNTMVVAWRRGMQQVCIYWTEV